MKKLLVLIAGGIGYVLGTKAGRERYDQIRGTFNKVKDDPRVQEKAHQAAGTASEKVKSATSSSTPDPSIGDDKLNPESLHFQDKTGPQGDLP